MAFYVGDQAFNTREEAEAYASQVSRARFHQAQTPGGLDPSLQQPVNPEQMQNMQAGAALAPPQPMLPTGQSAAEPSSNAFMVKGSEVMDVPPEHIAYMETLGFQHASEQQVADAQARRGETEGIGRGLQTAAEGFMGTLMSLGGAGLDLVTDDDVSGRKLVAMGQQALYDITDGKIGQEMYYSQRGMRARAEERWGMNLIGEAAAGYLMTAGIGGAGGVGTQALGRLGMGARTAQVGAAGLEGFSFGVLAENEAAMLEDREFSGEAAMANGLLASTMMAALPLGAAAFGKLRTEVGEQFAKRTAYVEREAQKAMSEMPEVDTRSLWQRARGMAADATDADRELLENLGYDVDTFYKEVGGLPQTKFQSVNDNVMTYMNATLREADGSVVPVHLTGAPTRKLQEQNAMRVGRWYQQTQDEIDKLGGDTRVTLRELKDAMLPSFDERFPRLDPDPRAGALREMFDYAVDRETGEILTPKSTARGIPIEDLLSDADRKAAKTLRGEVDAAAAEVKKLVEVPAAAQDGPAINRARAALDGKKAQLDEFLDSAQFSGQDFMKHRRAAIKNMSADMGPGERAIRASILEEMDQYMGEAHIPELLPLLREGRAARAMLPGAGEIAASRGGVSGIASLGEAASDWLLGAAVGPFHGLRAASLKIGATRKAYNFVTKRARAEYMYRQYYQGTKAVQLATEDAIESAFKRGAMSGLRKGRAGVAGLGETGARWAAKGVNFARRSGGFMSNAAGRSYIPATLTFAKRGQSDQDAYGERMQELSYALQQPELILGSLNGSQDGLAEGFPQTNGHMQVTMQKGLGYLAQKAPQPTALQTTPMTPNAPTRPPSAGEARSFGRRWETVMNPYSAVEAFANGRLKPEQAEALSIVYPKLHHELVTQVMGRAAQEKEALSPSFARQIDMLMGTPGAATKSARPDFQMRYAQLAEGTAQEADAAPKPSGSKPGRKEGAPTLAQQMRSPAEKAFEGISNT